MKHLVLVLSLSVILSGCEKSGSSDSPVPASAPAVSPGGARPRAKTIAVEHSNAFSCSLIDTNLYCWGQALSAPVQGIHAEPTVYARSVVDFQLFDSSIALNANVSQLPFEAYLDWWAGVPIIDHAGVAAYVFGAHTLSLPTSYNHIPDVGWPIWPSAITAPPELQSEFSPCMAVDGQWNFQDTGVFTDTKLQITSESLDCTEDAGVLTCPGLSITL